MSEPAGSNAPELFHANWNAPAARPPPILARKQRRPPRPGQRSILLSAANERGGSVFLAFTRTRGGIDFWRSLSPQRTGLQHVTTFPGTFTPRAVAQLLASGAARPAVDAPLAEDSEIDGVDDVDANLLRLAWCRLDGQLDPRAAMVLALPATTLAGVAERTGRSDLGGLLELGEDIVDGNEEWLAKWRTAVDAEVDRRSSSPAVGEQRRRELRAFVERCLLALGRLPRATETENCWDGTELGTRFLRGPELRKLGLYLTGRAGKFHFWVRFWTAAETFGYPDLKSGPGWYWGVTNPDPGWVMTCTMGPYLTPEEAWSDAKCLEEQE